MSSILRPNTLSFYSALLSYRIRLFSKLLLPTALGVCALSLLLIFWVPELTRTLQQQDQRNALRQLHGFAEQQFSLISKEHGKNVHPFATLSDIQTQHAVHILPAQFSQYPENQAIHDYFNQDPTAEFFEFIINANEAQHLLVSPIRLTNTDCVACHNQEHVNQKEWQLNDIAGFITLGLDQQHLAKQASKVRQDITLIILPFIILMLTCAILTYRRTQANVAKLLDTAGDITQGNLKRRVAIEGHDELARFGQAMDIMLDTLEQTQSELVTSQQDLRHVSKDLKQLNIELEQRVFERTDSLNNALSTLKNTQAELIKNQGALTASTLVAGIAHDINNPLGIALTAITFLRDENTKINIKLQQQTIKRSEINTYIHHIDESSNIIETNLRQAADLIRSFKDVSLNQCNDALQNIALFSFLQGLLLSLSPELKKAGIKYQISVPNDLVLRSYPGFLSQILTNLVLNSIRHGFDSGQHGLVTIKAYQEDKQITFDYADDGRGISPDIEQKIFSPFFTTRKETGGSGLGLNMVKELITHQLNGSIQVYHVKPHGLGFLIRLPIPDETSVNEAT